MNITPVFQAISDYTLTKSGSLPVYMHCLGALVNGLLFLKFGHSVHVHMESRLQSQRIGSTILL